MMRSACHSESKNLFSIVSLLLALTTAAWSQSPPHNQEMQRSTAAGTRIIVRDVTFKSESLGREMHFRIILPADHDSAARRYPVLYLLHGLTGHYVDWESRTHLDDYVAGLPLIVAMPEGDDSWYTNSATNPQEKWEDYIVKDFIPYVDSHFRTIQTRHARAIAGLSMGGYGAMKLALKYPGMFVFAGSMSGALNVANDTHPFNVATFNEQVEKIYGPMGSSTHAENDPFALAAKVKDPSSLPYLWLACGTEDHLVETNHEFINLLVKQKIPHFYEESAGAHTWKFWDEHLPPMLWLLMNGYFGVQPSGLRARAPMPPPAPPRRPNP